MKQHELQLNAKLAAMATAKSKSPCSSYNGSNSKTNGTRPETLPVVNLGMRSANVRINTSRICKLTKSLFSFIFIVQFNGWCQYIYQLQDGTYCDDFGLEICSCFDAYVDVFAHSFFRNSFSRLSQIDQKYEHQNKSQIVWNWRKNVSWKLKWHTK